jgi:hypothetical protein
MLMNTSVHSEVLRGADQVKEHRGNPRVDTVRQEFCASEQIPPRNPDRPYVPDEGAFFVDGAGI